MKVNCFKCNTQIRIPSLAEEYKYEICWAVVEEMPMWGVKFVRDYFILNIIKAKEFVKHTNKTFSICFDCEYNELKEEDVICLTCKALNLN